MTSESWARRAVVVGVLCTSAVALAYVLPSWAILRRMTEARDELHLFTLRVDGTVAFSGEATRQAAAALGVTADRPELISDAALLFKMPGRCRLDVTPIEGGKLAAVQASGKLRVEGTAVPAVSVAVQQLCALLGYRSSSEGEARGTVEKYLRSLKIDPEERTSLARFGGTVAYVIGNPAEGRPQFWVYKDAFLPARLRFTDEQGTAWDVRLLDYSSPATGEWFPRIVEVYRGAELQLRFTSLKADLKAPMPDKLF